MPQASSDLLRHGLKDVQIRKGIILACTTRFLASENVEGEGNGFGSECWEAVWPKQICVDIMYLNLLFVISCSFIYQFLLQTKDPDFTNI